MKKIISLVLSLMLVACVFAGCSNTPTSENAVTVTVNFVADGAGEVVDFLFGWLG